MRKVDITYKEGDKYYIFIVSSLMIDSSATINIRRFILFIHSRMFFHNIYIKFPFQTSPKERRKQFGKTRKSQSMDFEDTEELNGPIIIFVSSNSFRRATSLECSNCSQIQTSRFSHTAIVNISWEVTFQNLIRSPP